jgi:hypothetical protein
MLLIFWISAVVLPRAARVGEFSSSVASHFLSSSCLLFQRLSLACLLFHRLSLG